MSVVEELTRLGGVARRQAIVALTSRPALDSAVNRGQVVRVAHGRYALPTADDAMAAAHALSGVVCLESAALRWGWAVKFPPERVQVAVPGNRNVAAARAAKVDLRRFRLGSDDVVGQVTSRDRTLLDCLRLLPFDAALAVADSALRDDYPAARMGALVRDARGPHVARMRRIAGLASGDAANPFESVLRAIALTVPGLSVRPQVSVRRPLARGGSEFLGRPDLVDERLRIVIEADSFEWHGERRALRADARRYNVFVVEGWLVLRFSWEDVMFGPEYVAGVLTTTAAERTHMLCPCCRATP